MDKKQNILIVDDNLLNLELLNDIIKSEGYVLITAFSGQEALDMARHTPLDLILLDINMPGMDGYEVCRQFKADDKLRDIPIIFLTAVAGTKDKLKGFEVGGVDYITKPFHPNEVIARMKAHLLLRSTQAQLQEQNKQLQNEMTRRKQADDALKDSEQRYREIIETTGEAVFTTDLLGFFTYANPVMINRSGYSVEELIGTHFTELIKESWRGRVLNFYQKQFADRVHETVLAFPLYNSHDKEVWVEQTTNLVMDGEKITGFLGISRDITESRRVQMALQRSEHQLSKAQHVAKIGSFEWDIETGRITVSEAMYNLFHLDAQELGDLSIEQLIEWIHPDDIEEIISRQQMAIAGHNFEPLECRIILPDKTEKIAYTEAEILFDNSGNPVSLIGILQDITERKHLENALRESEQRYRLIVENAVDAVYTTDATGHFTYINKVGEKMTGYPAQELMGKHFTGVIPQDQQEHVLALYIKQFQDRIQETRHEIPMIMADGEEGWIEQTTILLTEGKYVTGFQSISRDVTERKTIEADRERLIAELDSFAHTVAHDLKTPLSTLALNSDMLESMFDKMSEERRKKSLQRIQATGQKMADIINALLLLASIRKQEDIATHPLDMATIIAEALERLNTEIEQYEADIIIADTFPSALGYALWVEEVWMNYLSNALKYGGDPPSVKVGADTLSNGSVRFWVKDNGAGLSPEDQSELFIPFTRLNQIDIKGHGLGLSIVQRIVEKLGGTIGIDSEIGQGSTFFFILPTV